MSDIAAWKTVSLGTYKTASEYREALEKAGVEISEPAREILESADFIISPEPREVELALVGLYDLFTEGELVIGNVDILARAKEKGLIPCPPEAAFALRLAYADQPDEEQLCVITEKVKSPITISTSDPYNIFTVESMNGTLRLYAQTLNGYNRAAVHDPLYVFKKA